MLRRIRHFLGGRKPPFFRLSCVLLAMFPLQSLAEDWHPYFIFDSFSYSETVSIRAAFNEWETQDFDRGKRQWTSNWIEAGIRTGDWSYGLVQRFDYALEFTEDASELYWQVTNKRDLTPGQHFDVEVNAQAIHATGLRVAYYFDALDSLQGALGLTLLRANYLIDGQLQGQADALNDSDFDYAAYLNWTYTEDRLLDRVVNAPVGYGAALDFQLRYRWQAHAIAWEVKDLPAWIYWHKSPFTEAIGRSDRKHYDERGYVSIEPAVSGREAFYSSYRQTLSPRMRLGWQYYAEGWVQPLAEIRYQYEHALYGAGVALRWETLPQLDIKYWPLNHSLEIQARQAGQWTLGLMADHYDRRKVRTLGLVITWGL